MSTNKRKAQSLAELRKNLSDDAPSIVRVILDRKGWTQQRLADELHTYQATVARWQAGTHVPRGGYLAALSRLLKDITKQYLREESRWAKPRLRKKKKYKLSGALTPSEAIEVKERERRAEIMKVLDEADQMIGLYRDTAESRGKKEISGPAVSTASSSRRRP